MLIASLLDGIDESKLRKDSPHVRRASSGEPVNTRLLPLCIVHSLRLADKDILNRLVGELKVLLEVDVISNLEEDDGRTDDEGGSKDTPGGDEEGVVLGLETIETPVYGGTCTLDTLVESSQVGSLAARVGEGTEVPGVC